jgi:hypothetical protein
MRVRENQRKVVTLRILAGIGRWLFLAIVLYVATFQVMALVIGWPQTTAEWLGWNRFLFAPGLEYPTAMQALSVGVVVLAGTIVGAVRLARFRRQHNA